jgi:hypothetical protein
MIFRNQIGKTILKSKLELFQCQKNKKNSNQMTKMKIFFLKKKHYNDLTCI